MRKLVISAAISALLLSACDSPQPGGADSDPEVSAPVTDTAADASQRASNPFFAEYKTPFGMPPFEKIKDEHYMPAFERAIAEQKAEIEAIANNSVKPTFANTIEEMEYSGELLTKVSNVFYNLTSAHTNERLQAIAKKVGPMLSNLRDDINLNPALFERVAALYRQKDKLGLRADQVKLLEDKYRNFSRGGADLNDADKQKLRDLNAKITELTIKFGDNVLAETNNFELVVSDKADLAGLPQHLIDAAATEAEKRDHKGQWVFTTHRPSKTPFLMYAQKRDLREKMWKGYTQRGDNGNANDNQQIAAKIAALRAQKAILLGYKTHADFVLEENTAKNPENVYKLLNKIWPANLAQAKKERADMQQLANAEGGRFTIAAWDWRYYAEKIRKARYDLDEDQTKPYFSLEDTLRGVFYVANKLYGMTFKERTDLPTYHEDVRTFEVHDGDGSLLGIYLTDHYVRSSKRGGAWMNAYRGQHVKQDGEFVKPIIVNVLNFPRPIGDTPTLLTFDQASTLFHEFGHAAHGFLSNGIYPSQAGTSVPRDFVEFPSQVMENWMLEPEVLAQFAKHYKTGEVIPQSLIKKIQAASKFSQGFATTEYMAASLLDMAWHTQTDPEIRDAKAFEKKTLDDLGLIAEIAPRYRTGYFSHIFSGGYSSGYYGYIWSEILAADAYHLFKERGIFDQKTAKDFREFVLSRGGSDDPMKLYLKFRGQEPDPRWLLESRGLLDAKK